MKIKDCSKVSYCIIASITICLIMLRCLLVNMILPAFEILNILPFTPLFEMLLFLLFTFSCHILEVDKELSSIFRLYISHIMVLYFLIPLFYFFFSQINPNISVIGVSDNILYLKEGKKTIQIFPKNDYLYCSYDNSFDCKHIKYSFAIPEVSKLDLKNNIN